MASNLSPPFRTLKVCTIRWGLDVRASTFFARHCRRDVLTSLLLRLVLMQLRRHLLPFGRLVIRKEFKA